MTGVAICDGELDFPGLRWGVMVRVPEEKALANSLHQSRNFAIATLLSALGLVSVGWRLSGSIAGSLQTGIDSLEDITSSLDKAAEGITESSQTVATGASEQAASLEESSASLEDISAMARRTAENSVSGKELSAQAMVSPNSGMCRLDEMTRTLGSIRSAIRDLEAAVAQMQESSKDVVWNMQMVVSGEGGRVEANEEEEEREPEPESRRIANLRAKTESSASRPSRLAASRVPDRSEDRRASRRTGNGKSKTATSSIPMPSEDVGSSFKDF